MESNRELSCPQCGNPFEQREVQGVVVDYCLTCGGVWLDPGELDELTGYKRARSGTAVSDDDDEDHVESEASEGDDQTGDDDSDGILGAVADALTGGGRDDVDEWDDDWDGGWDSGDGGDGGGGWGGGGDGGGGGGE